MSLLGIGARLAERVAGRRALGGRGGGRRRRPPRDGLIAATSQATLPLFHRESERTLPRGVPAFVARVLVDLVGRLLHRGVIDFDADLRSELEELAEHDPLGFAS